MVWLDCGWWVLSHLQVSNIQPTTPFSLPSSIVSSASQRRLRRADQTICSSGILPSLDPVLSTRLVRPFLLAVGATALPRTEFFFRPPPYRVLFSPSFVDPLQAFYPKQFASSTLYLLN